MILMILKHINKKKVKLFTLKLKWINHIKLFLNCWQKFKTEESLHIVYIKNMYARKKYGLELIRIICPKWLSFLQRDLCFLNIFKERKFN